VKQSYRFLSTTTAYLRYPTWGISNETLTYIVALDQYASDTGGYANVVDGGVGQKYVALSFRSQKNRGLKFIVEIYGK
jgi:hypothetical protein